MKILLVMDIDGVLSPDGTGDELPAYLSPIYMTDSMAWSLKNFASQPGFDILWASAREEDCSVVEEALGIRGVGHVTYEIPGTHQSDHYRGYWFKTAPTLDAIERLAPEYDLVFWLDDEMDPEVAHQAVTCLDHTATMIIPIKTNGHGLFSFCLPSGNENTPVVHN